MLTASSRTHSRGYDAAKPGRLRDGWLTSLLSPNREVLAARLKLAQYAREQARNNPIAAAATERWTNNIVGEGIKPRFQTAASGGDLTTVRAAWDEFVEQADAEGDSSLYGLQAFWSSGVYESGEVLIRKRPRRRGDLRVPFQLQTLEMDYLDANRDAQLDNGGRILGGKEFDRSNRCVAYWLHTEHPNDGYRVRRNSSIRISADDVIHLFDSRRPGQNFGVTRFAPVLLKLVDLNGYGEAHLTRKRIAACLAVFIKDVDGSYELGPTETPASRQEWLTDMIAEVGINPGQVSHLPPGTDVSFSNPPTDDSYPDYMRVELHTIAAALGLTYELLTGDLSAANYSSMRGGLLEVRRGFRRFQREIMCQRAMRRVNGWFQQSLQVQGEVSPFMPITTAWTMPRFEAIDPLKDAMADLIEMRAGVKTLSECITEQGGDFDQWIQERTRELADIDAAGIIVDSDPRKVSKSGIAQQAETILADD